MESQSLRKRQTIIQPKGRVGSDARAQPSGREHGHRRRVSMMAGGGHARQRSFSGKHGPAINAIREEEEEERADTSYTPTLEEDPNFNPELLAEGFNPREYIAATLSTATPEEIDGFGSRLREQIETAVRHEQETVRRNYETLLTVSRDVSELGPQISGLRKLVADLHVVSDALKQDAEAQLSNGNGVERSMSQVSLNGDTVGRTANRNSMLMLNNAWAKDFLELYRRVEGSQKYLPSIPGRHVVLESGSWYELNPVTWQPLKPVTMFLISDHFLIATTKRTRAHGETNSQRSLVVDQCWPFLDLQLENISAQENIGAALEIRVPSQSFYGIYKAPALSALRTLMSEFRKTQGAGIPTDAAAATAAANGSRNHKRTMSGASQLSGGEASIEKKRAAAKIIAGIDRLIAYHEYDKCADLCILHGEDELIVAQIAERKEELVRVLLRKLEQGNVERSDVVDTVRLLAKLDQKNAAKTAYLENRSQLLQTRQKELFFQGDIVNYVSQMAVIYFQIIKATIKVFCRAFPSRDDTSVLVDWVKNQVAHYGDFFNRQLYNIDTKGKTYRKCVEVTKWESSQLADSGMDMDFLLDYVWGTA